ncbi:MAG: ribonuclease P protein component [candidate division WOR-3 bacterium]
MAEIEKSRHFGKGLRLTREGEIRRVIKGRKKETRWATVFFLPQPETRAGFSARKALGNAVVRNRAKRRLREFFRQNREGLPRGWYLFVAKAEAAEGDFSEMCRGLLKELSLLSLYS